MTTILLKIILYLLLCAFPLCMYPLTKYWIIEKFLGSFPLPNNKDYWSNQGIRANLGLLYGNNIFLVICQNRMLFFISINCNFLSLLPGPDSWHICPWVWGPLRHPQWTPRTPRIRTPAPAPDHLLPLRHHRLEPLQQPPTGGQLPAGGGGRRPVGGDVRHPVQGGHHQPQGADHFPLQKVWLLHPGRQRESYITASMQVVKSVFGSYHPWYLRSFWLP